MYHLECSHILSHTYIRDKNSAKQELIPSTARDQHVGRACECWVCRLGFWYSYQNLLFWGIQKFSVKSEEFLLESAECSQHCLKPCQYRWDLPAKKPGLSHSYTGDYKGITFSSLKIWHVHNLHNSQCGTQWFCPKLCNNNLIIFCGDSRLKFYNVINE